MFGTGNLSPVLGWTTVLLYIHVWLGPKLFFALCQPAQCIALLVFIRSFLHGNSDGLILKMDLCMCACMPVHVCIYKLRNQIDLDKLSTKFFIIFTT